MYEISSNTYLSDKITYLAITSFSLLPALLSESAFSKFHVEFSQSLRRNFEGFEAVCLFSTKNEFHSAKLETQTASVPLNKISRENVKNERKLMNSISRERDR